MANEAAPQQPQSSASNAAAASDPNNPAAPLAKAMPSTDIVAAGEGAVSPFAANSTAGWALAQRMANALASSSIVPKDFVNSPSNCMIAMEYAARIGVSVLAVMQNLAIIHGKPGLSSQFLIGTVNASGRFTPLRFEFAGTVGKDDYACRAVAKDRASGEVLEGEWITWVMARKEQWVDRKGSKWQTMPGQMMRYRSAAFWVRVYCPEISLGFRTTDEIEDITGADMVVDVAAMPRELSPAGAKGLEAVLGLQKTAQDAVIDTQGESMPEVQATATSTTPTEPAATHDPDTGEVYPDEPPPGVLKSDQAQGSLLGDQGKGKAKR